MPDPFQSRRPISADKLNEMWRLAHRVVRGGPGIDVRETAGAIVVSCADQAIGEFGKARVVSHTGNALGDVGENVSYVVRPLGIGMIDVTVEPDAVWRTLANDSPAKLVPFPPETLVPVWIVRALGTDAARVEIMRSEPYRSRLCEA